jgi:hypothetical protein
MNSPLLSDISALKGCINLEELRIKNCPSLTDISPVKNLHCKTVSDFQ